MNKFSKSSQTVLWQSHEQSRIYRFKVNKKTGMKSVKESERLFAVQKELRQALCLQADNGICLVNELYSRQSREAEAQSLISRQR